MGHVAQCPARPQSLSPHGPKGEANATLTLASLARSFMRACLVAGIAWSITLRRGLGTVVSFAYPAPLIASIWYTYLTSAVTSVSV